MIRGAAAAKINLALVVGAGRPDGKHEIATVYQRITLADRIEVRVAPHTEVLGFPRDTLVRAALEALTADTDARLAARIAKRIPVAAGLGGGSADAAAALWLGNRLLGESRSRERLEAIARGLGADIPFFLYDGPQLGTGDGTTLEPLDLPQDYWIVVLLPTATAKAATAHVYASFDRRGGAAGFDERRAGLLDALKRVRRPRDLAGLPPNDLTSSPLAEELRALGAFRADVTGAGPAVYGLFARRAAAEEAKRRLGRGGRAWIAAPAWYV